MANTSIERSFRDLSDKEVADIEKASLLARYGWSGSFGWDELLRSHRVLIVSEAGTGKTYECRAQQEVLWRKGEAAFFLDLATLAVSSVSEMLSSEEEQRFEIWLRSQSEIATFFLDSIDELKLTLGKLDQSLKRLSKAVAGQLSRVRVVVTTRPVAVDRALIERYLPVPLPPETQPTAVAFADMMMSRQTKKDAEDISKSWRYVGLMPLSRNQMREFALLQGISDPDAFMADIRRRDAEEFAERPQDLIELCADWHERRQIRTHREQVESNIVTKLCPRSDRRERTSLSEERANEGASRLALAAILVRKLTLRYSAESDTVQASEAALNPSKILLDWNADERGTLLERPLFGFASYGRVRFHHRSVVEYLATKRLSALLKRGVPVKAIKRLLFAETDQGMRIVRPSVRPIAAWLALEHHTFFDDILAIDPAVVLNYGDPRSLLPSQRIRALEAYVARYRRGGWRGLNVEHIQVHRFASAELGNAVSQLWREGIENFEVRDLLLEIIAAGRLGECADIAYDVAANTSSAVREREKALVALAELRDARLEALAISVSTDADTWPDEMARRALLTLFPSYLPIQRLTQLLCRVKERHEALGELGYRFPREIETAEVSDKYLDDLRQALTDLIAETASWDEHEYPHLRTRRPDLVPALIAACHRQCLRGIRSIPWIVASLLAIRLFKEEYGEKDALATLGQALADLPSHARETAFWTEDAFLQRLRKPKDAWNRLFDLLRDGGLELAPSKDAQWVHRRLSDQTESLDRREMMLWLEMTSLMHRSPAARERLEEIRQLVLDAPVLVEIIDNRLKPPVENEETARLNARHEELKRQQEEKAAKAEASWVAFWDEIRRDPDAAFATDREEDTAWNLWRAMDRLGQKSRASGWSRRFIEEQFGKDVADRLRQTMSKAWRRSKPTLRSERPVESRNTFLVKWQFGLAAIAAEAEDPNWTRSLSDEEAELACRYAPLELNGLPSWLEELAAERPVVVDRILGRELSLSLQESIEGNNQSILLQHVGYASSKLVRLFFPRIRKWLIGISAPKSILPIAEGNLSQAIRILLEGEEEEDRRLLETLAKQWLADGLTVAHAGEWLRALFEVNPLAGVEILEKHLAGTTTSDPECGVRWFARLFGRDDNRVVVDITTPQYTPTLLLRLVRLAYQHVRIGEDAHHEGSYTPDMRDHAERGRNAVLSALLKTSGADGWTAKLEMAADPLFSHFRERIVALMQEKAAEEVDGTALTESQFALLDNYGETPPSTVEAMFRLMRDRLDDIDDLLLQDASPRETWASITEERLMRRELARELINRNNHIYTVDQEAVTADEKETDIRLRATSSDQQGIIELKIGEKDRSAAELCAALKNQLLAKYMAADACRAGCLVVTIASDKHWKHPKSGKRLNFEALICVLNEEAERLSRDMGSTAKLMAKGLDLRPRLATENGKRSAKLPAK